MLNSRNKDNFGYIHVKCEIEFLKENQKDKCPFAEL